MTTKYPSAVDAWLAVALISTPLLVISLGIAALTKSTAAGLIQIGIGIAVGGLIAALSLPCHYTIGPRSLRIKCGILSEDIEFSKIRGVEKSNSLWSAPALSHKRVKITLDDGFRLVSPKDREGFIEELQRRTDRKYHEG